MLDGPAKNTSGTARIANAIIYAFSNLHAVVNRIRPTLKSLYGQATKIVKVAYKVQHLGLTSTYEKKIEHLAEIQLRTKCRPTVQLFCN